MIFNIIGPEMAHVIGEYINFFYKNEIFTLINTNAHLPINHGI
jgi:hypothetical protein